MNHEVSGRTFLKVAMIHIIVIVLTLVPLGAVLHFKKKNEKFIEMVSLGTQNPAKGIPGPPQAVAKATAQKTSSETPAPAPPFPPSPPPPPQEEKAPAPEPEPIPQSKPITKSDPKPWDTPVPAPKTNEKKVTISQKIVERKTEAKTESQIKVNTKIITRKNPWSSAGDEPAKKSDKKSTGKTYGKVYEGPSEGEIASELKKGLQTVGVSNGSEDGQGMLGDPSGKSSWYHSLIRETFLRNWQKPLLPGAAKMEALVSIRIARDGSVTFLGLHKSSGNDAMDESVKKAAKSVSKLSQPLPSDLGHPDYEVIVNFRLD